MSPCLSQMTEEPVKPPATSYEDLTKAARYPIMPITNEWTPAETLGTVLSIISDRRWSRDHPLARGGP